MHQANCLTTRQVWRVTNPLAWCTRQTRIDSLAHRTGRSKSFYVKTALREYLTDLEDAFAADTAIDALATEGRRSQLLSALVAETER